MCWRFEDGQVLAVWCCGSVVGDVVRDVRVVVNVMPYSSGGDPLVPHLKHGSRSALMAASSYPGKPLKRTTRPLLSTCCWNMCVSREVIKPVVRLGWYPGCMEALQVALVCEARVLSRCYRALPLSVDPSAKDGSRVSGKLVKHDVTAMPM